MKKSILKTVGLSVAMGALVLGGMQESAEAEKKAPASPAKIFTSDAKGKITKKNLKDFEPKKQEEIERIIVVGGYIEKDPTLRKERMDKKKSLTRTITGEIGRLKVSDTMVMALPETKGLAPFLVQSPNGDGWQIIVRSASDGAIYVSGLFDSIPLHQVHCVDAAGKKTAVKIGDSKKCDSYAVESKKVADLPIANPISTMMVTAEAF